MVLCEQRHVVSARRVVFLQLAAAVGAACAANAANFDDGPVQQPQPQQQRVFPLRRGLQASGGTTAGNSAGVHECVLCWMLALAVFAGAAAALLQFCRHKRAEQGDEVKTPLSATAASANPFGTPNDPTSVTDTQAAATLGAGLSAKGRFTKPSQSDTQSDTQSEKS